MKNKVFMMLLLVVVVSLGVVVGCTPAAEPDPVENGQAVMAPEKIFEWKAQSIYTPGEPGFAIQTGFVDRVRELSGGRLDITLHAIGTIVPAGETFEAVSMGVLEVGMKNPMWWGGTMPVGRILTGLPGAFTHAYQLNHWYWEHGGIDIAREAYAAHNIFFVGPTPFGAPPLGAEVLHSHVPIRTMEDFQGLKIRTAGAAAVWFEALGASTVHLPGAEIFTALEKGVVDVAEWIGVGANIALGLHEAAPYVIVPGLHAPTQSSEVIVNMDVWNELPSDLKVIMEVALRETALNMAMHYEALDGKAIGRMAEYGVEVIEWSPEELARARKFAIALWDDFAVDEISRRALDSQIEYLKLIGIVE